MDDPDVEDPTGPETSPDTTRRRGAVRELLRDHEVRGPRDLRRRLDERGFPVDESTVRADLRAVGATRVDGPSGPVLALEGRAPAGRSAGQGSAARFVTADPDWRLQVTVAAVVAAFVLVGLIGWLIGG